MKHFWKAAVILTCMMVLTGCSKGKASSGVPQENYKDLSKRYITVGFSQLGAESDWRRANTNSMRETLTKENGFELFLEDGQQKQSNQIMAIRKFIQQEVDYIVLAPVTETGWDTVLQEARDANIPVILVDRMADVDEDLFTCFVGSDFELEAKKVASWLEQYSKLQEMNPEDLHIVDIQGNLGASAQIGRTKGLEDAAKVNGWDLLALEPGDFTETKGKEVMQSFLKQYDNINVVFCENDNEAFGAIEALEEAGKKVGSQLSKGEVMVVSFDGVGEKAIQYVVDGKISCIGECNPLHGPRVEAIIRALQEGKTPEKISYVDEGIIVHDESVKVVSVGSTVYSVTVAK